MDTTLATEMHIKEEPLDDICEGSGEFSLKIKTEEVDSSNSDENWEVCIKTEPSGERTDAAQPFGNGHESFTCDMITNVKTEPIDYAFKRTIKTEPTGCSSVKDNSPETTAGVLEMGVERECWERENALPVNVNSVEERTTLNTTKGTVQEASGSQHCKTNRAKELTDQPTETCFICKECGESFPSMQSLKSHYVIHTRWKPITCTICSKVLANASFVKRHMKTHEDRKPFPCTDCGKVFPKIGSLNRHVRTHTGEKPFGCSECGKSFSQSCVLQTHIRSHTGERPFPCKVCHKAFSQLSHLKIHTRTHTGEKPFPCSMCCKAFNRVQELNRHVFTHSKEKPFSCDVCNKMFTQLGSLRTHIKSKHPV